VVFSLATPAVDILVEHAGIARFQIGDDEACIGSFRPDLDAGDDALDPAPAPGAIPKFPEAAQLAVLWRGFEAGLRTRLETLDMPAQRRCRRNAQDIIETVGPTPVENFGVAIMAVARSKISVFGQLARIARESLRRKARTSAPFGPLAGRSTAVMSRPSPSNTTIG
jgi:hypothetical protein